MTHSADYALAEAVIAFAEDFAWAPDDWVLDNADAIERLNALVALARAQIDGYGAPDA